MMNKNDKIKYWIETAKKDWTVTTHLFEKSDYSYSLFFAHLSVEKILKAIYVKLKDGTATFSHNLVYLAEKSGLEVNAQNLELLEEISDFNLEARYPDEKLSFYKKCTKAFTNNKLKQIKELRKWLLQQLQ